MRVFLVCEALNSMPKVSIILPVHNGGNSLKQAIGSVLAQDFLDWELIVINDGSSDNSWEVVQGFQKDPRIKLLNHFKNLGLIQSLNDGLQVASGEYLARIDSDDLWTDSSKLSKQVDFLDSHPEVGLLGSWARCVDQKGKKLFQIKPPEKDGDVRKQILLHNCFVHSSILARIKLLRNFGGYSANDSHIEDYSLWLQLGKVARFWNLPEIMVNYRLNLTGITQTKNLQQIRAVLRLIRQYRHNYPNFFRAWLKWTAQLIITEIFGVKALTYLKIEKLKD